MTPESDSETSSVGDLSWGPASDGDPDSDGGFRYETVDAFLQEPERQEGWVCSMCGRGRDRCMCMELFRD